MGEILTTKEFTDALEQIDYCFDGYYRGGVDGIESVVEQIRCHDNALRTQARELAEALADNRELLCPYYYGTEQRAAWLLQDEAYQRALATLKEGR